MTVRSAAPLPPVLLWFRQDLRLADNPAVHAAVATGRPVIPVFVLDCESPGPWAPGGASLWWLHHSLASLTRRLESLGSRLILRRGRFDEAIPRLAAETEAVLVVASHLYEPWAREVDRQTEETLARSGVEFLRVNSTLLFEPWTIRTRTGGAYSVYTPFARACFAAGPPPSPVPAPVRLATPTRWPTSDALAAWRLLPHAPDWASGFRATWTPGEEGAEARLARFLDRGLARYAETRNRPDVDLTSRLSPHLRWGEISPWRVWHAIVRSARTPSPSMESFLNELVWREFAYHLLWHRPEMPSEPLRPQFARFPWRNDPQASRAWREGRTGYPIVDAGMRQLWQTGWMHNRVRMIVASFFVKHLLLPWQEGEAWFWDTLVDADLASNSASWQWVAGSGADATPYFRIFAPVGQGEKFDPNGDYVRRWVPELARLPAGSIHAPWSAPPLVLAEAGVALGRTYPFPIVDHAAARARALAALAAVSHERVHP